MPYEQFNRYCENLLVQYSRRKTGAVQRHIDGLCDVLRQEGGHVLQIMFGGSVSKNTYVNGLSDVDVLLVVNQSSLANRPPRDVLNYASDAIIRRLPMNPVIVGNLAVSVDYSDGTKVQILPAIRTSDGVRIAQPGSTTWSNVVWPHRFAEELQKVNSEMNGRIVPTIKLAKAIADCFIRRPSRKITGYHIESLAIQAFRDYDGPLDHRATLNHLFRHSIKAVLTPIVDPTGQSRRVDDYLGPAKSRARKRTSTYFGQMRGKINSCKTRKEVAALFCHD